MKFYNRKSVSLTHIADPKTKAMLLLKKNKDFANCNPSNKLSSKTQARSTGY